MDPNKRPTKHSYLDSNQKLHLNARIKKHFKVQICITEKTGNLIPVLCKRGQEKVRYAQTYFMSLYDTDIKDR